MFNSQKDDSPKECNTEPDAVTQSESERSSRMDKARGNRIVKPK